MPGGGAAIGARPRMIQARLEKNPTLVGVSFLIWNIPSQFLTAF